MGKNADPDHHVKNEGARSNQVIIIIKLPN
jgi:hypothetical protein